MGPDALAKARTNRAFEAPPPATVKTTTAGETGAGFRASMMTWTTKVGPTGATSCEVLGELFVPSGATAARPVPAILTTNGFGGSYEDQLAFARYFARRGYAVLSYSGLGFGGSGCNITLDSPEWDGAAASQLISYLGTRADITKDGAGDPRVGMIGGSYGGAVQFSTASIDPRLDTIVPLITWNDLAYSLGPNNGAADLRWSSIGPGVPKLQWASLFFALGLSQPLQHGSVTPRPPSACPGFDPGVCRAYVTSAGLGYLDATATKLLRNTSMTTFHDNVRLPVMLMQGEADSLFNINEAVANYRLLKSAGSPVKLVLQSWGHSHLTPAAGEVSYEDAGKGYETLLIQRWFAKWLKDDKVSTGPEVEYFRGWVDYDKAGSAAPAYGSAAAWPVGSQRRVYLSGNGRLVGGRDEVKPGTKVFANTVVPSSESETSAVGDQAPFVPSIDAPPASAAFNGETLRAPVDVVGIPTVRVRLSTSTPPMKDPLTQPVVFAKLFDVDAGGKATLVERLVAPVRLADLSSPVTITLPGIVHRFPAGHHLRLVLAATDAAYTGSRVPAVLTVTLAADADSYLELPVV